MSAAWVARTPPGVPVLGQALPEVHAPGHVSREERRRRLGLSRDGRGSVPHRHRADRRRRHGSPRILHAVSVQLSRRRRTRARTSTGCSTGWRGYPLAVELRHRSWSDDGRAHAVASSTAHRASWALIDEPKFHDSIRTRSWRSTRTSRPLPRAGALLHPAPRPQRHVLVETRASEDRYNYLYSADELEPFADVARGGLPRRDVACSCTSTTISRRSRWPTPRC